MGDYRQTDSGFRAKCVSMNSAFSAAMIAAGHKPIATTPEIDALKLLSKGFSARIEVPWPGASPRTPYVRVQAAYPTGRSIAAVASQVAHRHGLSVAELTGSRHTDDVVKARGEAFYICKRILGRSYSEIGRFFKKDRTAVQHGVRRHISRISEGL